MFYRLDGLGRGLRPMLGGTTPAEMAQANLPPQKQGLSAWIFRMRISGMC